MSSSDTSPENVLAPKMGAITVTAVSTTASAWIDTGVSTGPGQYFSFVSDVDTYYIFDELNTAATNPVVADVTTDTRCWFLPQKTVMNLRIRPASRYFKVISTASGTLRHYRSGD